MNLPNGEIFMSMLRNALIAAFVLSTAVSLRGGDSSLAAFQTAIGHMGDDEGCLSIPYADKQDECIRKQREVNKWCKDSGPMSCQNIDPKDAQKRIEEIKTTRDTLKSEKENLERKKSASSDDAEKSKLEDDIEAVERKIYENEQKRNPLEQYLSVTTKEINDRLYIAKSCRDYRLAVQQVFGDAKSRARSESDDQIRPLAKDLAESWERKERGHEEAIKGVKSATDHCEEILYAIGHLGSF
jgi:hypothetical protein